MLKDPSNQFDDVYKVWRTVLKLVWVYASFSSQIGEAGGTETMEEEKTKSPMRGHTNGEHVLIRTSHMLGRRVSTLTLALGRPRLDNDYEQRLGKNPIIQKG